MSVVIARDLVREPLYAIVPVQNPWRWKSRYKLTDRALKHFHDSGVVIVLVEACFNRREAVYADSGMHGTMSNCRILGASDDKLRHRYIGLRTKDELWLKENLINVGVQSLPYDWQQVCWLDSDVVFTRPNWAGECIQKLQHYKFLQMFSQAHDLAPNYELLPENYPHAAGVSFVQSWRDGDLDENLRFKKPINPLPPIIQSDLAGLNSDAQKVITDIAKLTQDLIDPYYGGEGPRRVFPGLAWACTRSAWDDVGGLMDYAIWGGSDWSSSHALVGRREGMMHAGLHPNFKTLTNEWADRCDRYIRQNVGVMQGAVLHNWHGKKTARGYGDKHRILARLQFDPLRHLKRDSQGLWQLHDDGSDQYVGLRDSFRRIAMERNEDSPEL
jgi:hypothetical protein